MALMHCAYYYFNKSPANILKTMGIVLFYWTLTMLIKQSTMKSSPLNSLRTANWLLYQCKIRYDASRLK